MFSKNNFLKLCKKYNVPIPEVYAEYTVTFNIFILVSYQTFKPSNSLVT